MRGVMVCLLAGVATASACGRIGFGPVGGEADMDAGPNTGGDGSVVSDGAVASDGATATGWFETTPLPSPRNLACAVTWAGHLIVTGGTTGGSIDEVVSAPISKDGSLGSWTQQTPLPTPTGWHACAVDEAGESLYVLGGTAGSNVRSEVFRAPLASDGTVGAWSSESPLPAPRRGFVSVAHQGHLFAIGGEESSGFVLRDTVYVAAIGAGGALGAWTTTTPLPTADYVFGAATDGQHLFTTGGYRSADTAARATIGGGNLGPFSTTTPMPGNRQRHASIVLDGHLYIIGGEATHSGAHLTDGFRAPIEPGGELGAWSEISPLPHGFTYPGVASHQGRIYLAGGRDEDRLDRVIVLNP